MGIAFGALPFLMEEGRREPWRGSVLTLGRQDMGFTESELRKAADLWSFSVRDVGTDPLTEKPDGATRGFVSDTWFFKALGFDWVSALDANNYEGADMIHDLNTRPIPEQLRERFDLVLDGGTLEHVFDIASALRSVCEMTKVGGRIVHISPMSNCPDHGFYCFSPTLFADFYSANGFMINRLTVIRFEGDPVSDPWEYREYRPGDFGTIGELRSGAYFLMACVHRLASSRTDVIPQQAFYRNSVWRQSAVCAE